MTYLSYLLFGINLIKLCAICPALAVNDARELDGCYVQPHLLP